MAKALVLVGISGERIGASITLAARTNSVGSGSNVDLCLHDRLVNPQHAELRQVLDRWFVVPLTPGSRIFINGSPVTGQGRIVEGDLLTLGGATFKVAFTESEQVVGAGASRSSTPNNNGIPRLGDYLVRKGFITSGQLERAVRRQNELTRQGRRSQLGDVLQDMGYISNSQLEQALQDQRGDFLDGFR